MALYARSRRGTSPSFWRNHNAMQMMMTQACMPSVRRVPVKEPETALSSRYSNSSSSGIGPAPKVFIARTEATHGG